MNREDLKVGMRIKYISENSIIYEVTGLGRYRFLYFDEKHNLESSLMYDHLRNYEPIPEKQELYYIWAIKSTRWYIGDEYLNKDGVKTDGRGIYDTRWEDMEKRILPQFDPIDKDGNVYSEAGK